MTGRLYGPKSCLFYLIANVDTVHRPLAVALHLPADSVGGGAFDGIQVVLACLRIIDVLSTPSNRQAIEAELSLAPQFYRERPLPRTWLPEVNRWDDDYPDRPNPQWRPWNRGHPEFPFISTCLLLAVGYGGQSPLHARLEPLGTTFRHDTLEYGMVVVDISSLDDIRYGIFASSNWKKRTSLQPIITVEENGLRRPLSAVQYLEKFNNSTHGISPDQLDRINQVPLVENLSLNWVEGLWPPPTPSEAPERSPIVSSHPDLSHRERSISDLINAVLEPPGHVGESLLDHVISLPHVSGDLLTTLLRHPNAHMLGQSPVCHRILVVAYSGKAHLNWAPFKALTTDAIAIALQSERLKLTARSIILCIDMVRGPHAELLDALCQPETRLTSFYFLQEPNRDSDAPSTNLFLEMLSYRPEFLLVDKLVRFSSAFSASLRKTFWLPSTSTLINPRPPIDHTFPPIQHLFARHLVRTHTPNPLSTPLKFWPSHHYLGDTFLPPERLATGFLTYLGRFLSHAGNHTFMPYALACAPPSLAEMDTNLRDIAPIPAENFAIPPRPLLHPVKGRQYAECWPKQRDVHPGQWVILVTEVSRGSPPKGRLRALRYVFVRIRNRTIPAATCLNPNVLKPDPQDLELFDLVGFLQATGCAVDGEVVKKALRETGAAVRHSNPSHVLRRYGGHAVQSEAGSPQSEFGVGFWLDSMVDSPDEACEMLRDFLEDGLFVRRNLKLAMRESPAKRAWYPELMEGEEGKEVIDGPCARTNPRYTTIATYGDEEEVGSGSDDSEWIRDILDSQ